MSPAGSNLINILKLILDSELSVQWSNADYTSPDLTFVFTPHPATPGQYNSSYSFHPSVRRLRPAGCRAAGLQYKTPAAGGAADSWLWWGPTSRPQLHREMRKCKVKLCCFLYPCKRGFTSYNPLIREKLKVRILWNSFRNAEKIFEKKIDCIFWVLIFWSC